MLKALPEGDQFLTLLYELCVYLISLRSATKMSDWNQISDLMKDNPNYFNIISELVTQIENYLGTKDGQGSEEVNLDIINYESMDWIGMQKQVFFFFQF